MNMRPLFLVVSVLILIGVACGKQATPPGPTSTPAVPESQLVESATLVRLGNDPPTLDPHLTVDTDSARYIVEVYGGLVSIEAQNPRDFFDLQLEIVGDLARESAPTGPCSVFGQPWRTSPSYAALVNGTMIGGFETDHAFGPGSSHPSAGVFPAVLAMAERNHLDGETLLVSVVLGYEVTCRVGRAATRAVEDQAGFHGPGTNAAFGAAAGAGKALGLDAGQLVNALGIAGSHAGGLLEFAKEGAMTKRIHPGRGAQMGLECALLASKGFTGPSTVLEGDQGFLLLVDQLQRFKPFRLGAEAI